jgi:transglutaminase-like putative cysteine protease
MSVETMRIHTGYELPAPTPMLLTLSVHPSRRDDLETPDWVRTDPPLDVHQYIDGFGNIVSRVLAPAGALTLSADFIIRDPAVIDEYAPDARQIAVHELPDEVVIFLLGSRYCETDRLSETAWSLFDGHRPGWSLVQAICDYVHNHIVFNYADARPTKSAWDVWQEGKGVCRDYAHLAVAFCRCLNIPARYCTGYLGDIGVGGGGDGLQRLLRGLSRRTLVHVRCPQQHAAHGPRAHRPRPRRHRRRHRQHLRRRETENPSP